MSEDFQMHVKPTPSMAKHVIEQVRPLIARYVKKKSVEDELYEIRLALTEAFSNVERHSLSAKASSVKVAARIVEHVSDRPRIEFTLSDSGTPPDPDRYLSRDPDDLRPGGLGLSLMSQMMDRVHMRVLPKKNVLTLARFLGAASDRQPQESFHVLDVRTSDIASLYFYGNGERLWRMEFGPVLHSRVRLDLSHLRSINSHAIREILFLGKSLETNGSRLEIARVSERIRRQLIRSSMLSKFALREALVCPGDGELDVLLFGSDDELFAAVRSAARPGRVRRAADWNSLESEKLRALPDVVILSMDGSSGRAEAALARLRFDPHWSAIPLILAGPHEHVNSFKNSIDDFCSLPIDPVELGFRIRRAVERSKEAGSSLSLLRALGSRFTPEAIETLGDQISALRQFGTTMFLVDHKRSPLRCSGWMKWGPMSFGSMIRVAAGPRRCLVVMGRGTKAGMASILTASTIAGLLGREYSDISTLAGEIAVSVRKLAPCVDPYFLGFAIFEEKRGWEFFGHNGPVVGSFLTADGAISIGSYPVDNPPEVFVRQNSSSRGPWRFNAPGVIDDVNADAETAFDVWTLDVEKVAA